MPPETQNNNENAENSENQNLNLSTTQNSNHNKKNVLIFAFIFVLVIIGIYFSYRFLNTQIFPYSNQEAPQVIQEKDEMLNWKTYRNEEYGFEFKYPPLMDGFRVVESDNNIKFYLDEPSSEWSSDDYNIFNIEIMTPEIWNEYLSNDSPRPIFLATSTNQVFGYWKGHDCPDNYCYLYENSQRILSTFKFIATSTPTTLDTSSWKTYINKYLGLSFDYPGDWSVTSISPSSDPYGAQGVYVEDPNIEFPGSGISISIDKSTTIKSVTNTLDVSKLISRIEYISDYFEWIELIYEYSNGEEIIIILAQTDQNIIRIGSRYSKEQYNVLKDIISSIKTIE